MSSLTTSEEIQKQLSIIFGYSGREEIQVGDIIGVGSLTKNKVNDLIFEVLNYLNAYNGMLRDYSGTEVYAIEFELINFYKNEQNLRLLPKSMILIPGEYKDSNTLLLALKQESSQLNFHKGRNSIDNLGKLFFEVEEVVERPELKNDEKKEVLNKFAKRFSRKIQGQLLEGKWDKKLVGIKTSSPTEEKNLEPFISLQSKYYINWSDINRNITADPPKYRENKLNLTDDGLYKHLKWSISGPSGFYITQNTLNFGTQLLRIANTGSINEVQENLVKLMVEEIEKYLSNLRKTLTYEEAINEIKHILRELKDSFTIYEQKMKKFLTSGERGNSENLYTLAKAQFENIPSEKIEFMNKILRIQIQLIDLKDFEKQKSIRVIEMEPYLNYFIQMAEMSYNIIKNNYERFYCYRYLLNLLDKLIIVAREELESEEKPAKALGSRFMDKIFKNLLNKINEKIINNVEGMRFNRIKMDNIFNELVKNTIEHYIDEISIYAEDLIGFAEIMLGEQAKKVEIHFDRLKKARTEFLFLLSFFLRNSTLNRFLKELRENEILNPISLSESFRKFMWKRIGGIKIYWKEYILDLIKEFGDNNKKKFEEDGGWSKYELINKMISHLKNRISEITEPTKFIEILDNYIGQIKDPTEQALMVLFFEQYEYSLDIVDDFPNYMKQKMDKILSQLNYSTTPIQPDGYLKSDEIQISVLSDGIKKNSLKEKIFGFYDFINEFELKYFSKLIARPSNLILRSIDKTSFSKTLYYNLEFKFWEKFFKINISSNWLQVRPKF